MPRLVARKRSFKNNTSSDPLSSTIHGTNCSFRITDRNRPDLSSRVPSRIGEGISTWALASIRLVSGDAAARLLGEWNRKGGCRYPICRFDFDSIKYMALGLGE